MSVKIQNTGTGKKHTPAPWKIERDRGDGKVIAISNPGDGWERLYVEVCSDDCDREVAQANARLIAAAPDLLEALKAIKESAEDGRDCPEWLLERLQDANAALRKATAVQS